MRIAIVDASLFSVPYDRQLVLALRARGHDVRWFGRRERSDEHDYGEDRLYESSFYSFSESPSVRRLARPLRLSAKGLDHALSMVRFVREMRRWRPDVIHFQWVPLPSIDAHFLAKLRSVAPLVLTVHDSTPFNASPSSGLQAVGTARALRTFDAVVVHTRAAARRVRRGGLSRDAVVRIPHGALAASSAADAAPSDAAEVLVVQFGCIKRYKGVDVLVRALAALDGRTRARCRVVVAGQPAIPIAPIRRLARELGVDDRIDFDARFLPATEMHALIRRAAVLVFPYRCIDASGVFYASVHAGRAMVASDLGIFHELLEDGVHGRLVPPEDPHALAAALAHVIVDDGARRRYGRAVRDVYESLPPWSEIAGRTESLYARVRAKGAVEGPGASRRRALSAR